MAAEKHTTHFSAFSEIHDAASPGLELGLPNGEFFRSLPPLLSIVEMIERSRQLRRWFPAGLRSNEERWHAKTAIEFHL